MCVADGGRWSWGDGSGAGNPTWWELGSAGDGEHRAKWHWLVGMANEREPARYSCSSWSACEFCWLSPGHLCLLPLLVEVGVGAETRRKGWSGVRGELAPWVATGHQGGYGAAQLLGAENAVLPKASGWRGCLGVCRGGSGHRAGADTTQQTVEATQPFPWGHQE